MLRSCGRSEEHTSELQSRQYLVCRLLEPPRSTLFPYTTLFRSGRGGRGMVALELAAPTLADRCAGCVRLHDSPLDVCPRRRSARRLSVFDGTFLGRRARRCCGPAEDRKSTRLNSSHANISYAVFWNHRDLHSFPTRRSSDLGVAVAAWWLWNSPRRPWLIGARVAFAFTILLWTSVLDVVPLDDCQCLTVHFLDVGQGDAAVLRKIGRAHV